MTEQQKSACERMITVLGRAIFAEDMNEIQRCLQFVGVGVSTLQGEIYQGSLKKGKS